MFPYFRSGLKSSPDGRSDVYPRAASCPFLGSTPQTSQPSPIKTPDAHDILTQPLGSSMYSKDLTPDCTTWTERQSGNCPSSQSQSETCLVNPEGSTVLVTGGSGSEPSLVNPEGSTVLVTGGSGFEPSLVNPEGSTVLVTGGSGFLGQHLVGLLHTRAPHVGQIHILDTQPFTAKLGQ